jgi:hypothetical protein
VGKLAGGLICAEGGRRGSPAAMAVVGARVRVQAGAQVAIYRRARVGREGLEGLQRGAAWTGEARGGRGMAGVSWSAHRAFCAAWRAAVDEGKLCLVEGQSRCGLSGQQQQPVGGEALGA